MIVSAAELMRRIKLAEKQDPALRVLEEKPKRTGRPRLGKRCQATKYGPCYRPLKTPDFCNAHAWRLKNYGDLYAGKRIYDRQDSCKSCDKRTYLIYAMRNGVRKIIVDDHYTKSGNLCRGSGYAPVRARRKVMRLW